MHAPEITVYNVILIAFIVFGFIIAMLIYTMVKQHRRHIALYKSKIAAEITTLENERKRVAADLHDDLGLMLSVIKFKISDIGESEEDKQSVAQAEEYIDEVVQKMRQISNDLMPGTLLRKGLSFALEEFIQRITDTHDLQIIFNHNEIPDVDDSIAINLYRIVLEIIHNTIKHSGASTLDISLQAGAQSLKLTTHDIGKGFDLAGANRDFKGLGLRTILNRTELLGGDMFAESVPGEGTTYTINIPFTKTKKHDADDSHNDR